MQVVAPLVSVMLALELGGAGGARAAEAAHAETASQSAPHGPFSRPPSSHTDSSIRLALFPRPNVPPPPSLISPVGGAGAAGARAGAVEPPATTGGANGTQVTMAILVAGFGAGTAMLVGGGTDSAAAAALPLLIATLGAGAVVCRMGAETPARPGRCRTTIIGALIGAAIGVLPGAVTLLSAGSAPHDESAYHDYIQNRFSGIVLAGFGFLIGMPTGTIIGFGHDPVTRPIAAPTPGVTAAAPIFTLRF